MIEIIVSILVELGLIREDWKHRKRIKQKEDKDGKQRPFQKYMLQPSVLSIVLFFGIMSVITVLYFEYQARVVYPKITVKEISQIREGIEDWHDAYGSYPLTLEELIGNHPMQQSWKDDAWHRPYRYLLEDGTKVVIVSAGPDGQFNTKDDILLD